MKTDITAYRAAIGVAAFMLLLLLLATQVADEVAWTLSDFVFVGSILLGAGFTYVLAATRMPKYRAVIGIGLAAVLLIIWIWAVSW